MRNFTRFVLAASALVPAMCLAQDEAKKEEKQKPKLYTQTFRLPPTYIAMGGYPVIDPNHPEHRKKRQKTAKDVLESAGVEFGEGSFVNLNGMESTLTVRNTAEQLDVALLYVKSIQETPVKQIHIILEHVEIDFELWNDWIFENKLNKDGTALRKQAQKWKTEGKADITETVIVTAKSGNRAKTEAVHEYVYPTEMDPAEIPHSVKLSGKETVAPKTGTGATAFETRSLGTILEVDPVLGADDVTIDLNISPETVVHDGFLHWPNEKSDPHSLISMPRFHAFKTTTQIVTIDGQYTLISAARPLKAINPERKQPFVLTFTRGDVSHVKGEEPDVAGERIPFNPDENL